MACARLDTHYEGLAKIAHVLAQRNMIDGSLKRTLLNVDTATAFVRHITPPKNDMLLNKLEQMLTPLAATYTSSSAAVPVSVNECVASALVLSDFLEPPVPVVQVVQVP